MMQETYLGIEGQTWIEMAVGLFLEGLLLGIIFQLLQNKQQKQSEKHMQDHLKQEDKQMQDLEKRLQKSQKEILQELESIRAAYPAHTHSATIADKVPPEQLGAINKLFEESDTKGKRGEN